MVHLDDLVFCSNCTKCSEYNIHTLECAERGCHLTKFEGATVPRVCEYYEEKTVEGNENA